MIQCTKCGTATEGGQNYRFYFGVVVESQETAPAPGEKPVDTGPFFQSRGSEDVFFCDRCLAHAAAREELLRAGFFLILEISALVVVVFLVWSSSRGLWAGLAALLIVGVLGGAAWRRYRCLRAALAAHADVLRQAVAANQKIQNLGDTWAIACRRQALQGPAVELFLTRAEFAFWSNFPPPSSEPPPHAADKAP